MPVQHRVKFETCPKNPADRAIQFNCSQVPKEFKANSRSVHSRNLPNVQGYTQVFNPQPVAALTGIEQE